MDSVQGGPQTIYQPTSLLRIQRRLYIPRPEHSTLPHYDTYIRYGPVCSNWSRDEHWGSSICQSLDGIGSFRVLRGPAAVE
jgi:hypothetical protein